MFFNRICSFFMYLTRFIHSRYFPPSLSPTPLLILLTNPPRHIQYHHFLPARPLPPPPPFLLEKGVHFPNERNIKQKSHFFCHSVLCPKGPRLPTYVNIHIYICRSVYIYTYTYTYIQKEKGLRSVCLQNDLFFSLVAVLFLPPLFLFHFNSSFRVSLSLFLL